MSTGLLAACQDGDLEKVRTMIQNGSDANAEDEDKRTGLHWAAANGHDHIVAFVLGAVDVDVNHQDDAGWTPLMSAVSAGHGKTVELLLKKGANANIANENGQIALHYHKGRKEIVEYLLDYTKDINKQDNSGSTPLTRALGGSLSVEVVYLLLDQGASLETTDINGNTPLHLAIEEQQDDLAVSLVEHGAKLLSQNVDKKSCIDLAHPVLRQRLEDARAKYKAKRC